MQLSPATEEALNGWIMTETWYTGNDFDMARFYKFVDQYQKNHGYTIDEPVLRKIMKDKTKLEETEKTIDEYIKLAYKILDFLKCTNR